MKEKLFIPSAILLFALMPFISPEGAYPASSISRTGQVAGYSTTANTHGGAKGVEIKVEDTGGGQSFSNLQPYLGVNYIICTEGVYPTRN